MLKKTICLALLAGLATPIQALTLCEDSESVYPWTLPTRPGLAQQLLRLAIAPLQLSLTIRRAPWSRCLEYARQGQVDGVYPVSYQPARASQLHYPLRGKAEDPAQRMLTDGYSLYRRRGDNGVIWDGYSLRMAGSVAAQHGYSILPWLADRGITIDDGAYTLEGNLRKLLARRNDAAALRTGAADHFLASHSALSSRLEKLQPPLEQKAYYLALSPRFYLRDPALARRLWQRIAQVRVSAEYARLQRQFR